MEATTTDVLVIGSGVAGLTAALHLAGHRQVLLVTAGPLESGNTPLAQGGIAAALGADDAPALHAEDTLAAGAGHCDEDAVAVLVREGPESLEHLRRLGVPLAGPGGWNLTQEAAHSRRRVAYVADHTGLSVHRGLAAAVLADERIQVRTGHRLLRLVTEGGSCLGAVLRGPDGATVAVRAGHTVLATGGLGQLYGLTTNSPGATGFGMAAAYAAGAALADLEFVQFHPTALWHEGRVVALVSEALRGEGAVLRAHDGSRFMDAVDARAELAPRDVVARAVAAQMQADGQPHVWLDARQLGRGPAALSAAERFPTITAACASIGLDPAKDLIPVAPAAHYSMGGVRTDTDGRTSLPGLLAVGEVACTGVHGANRLASNSLLEGLVFGRRAAHWLADQPAGRGRPLPSAGGGVSAVPGVPAAVAKALAAGAGLKRTGPGLQAAAAALARLPAGHAATLARLLVRAALAREESRGAHFRADFPAPATAWAGRRIVHELRQEVPV